MELSDFLVTGNKLNGLAFTFVNGLVTIKDNKIISKANKGEDLKELMTTGANIIYDSIKELTFDLMHGYSPMNLDNLDYALKTVPGLSDYVMIKKPEINDALKNLADNNGFLISTKFTYDNPFNTICVYKKKGEVYVKDNSSAFIESYKLSSNEFNNYLMTKDFTLIKKK